MKPNYLLEFMIFNLFLLMPTTLLAEQVNVPVPDTTISSNVQTNLDNDKTLIGTNIKATSKQGIVTLEGTAQNQEQVDAAVKDAKGITGVTQVKLKIMVLPNSTIPDSTISSNVQMNLDNDKLLAGEKLKVTTTKGIVTLEGLVDTQEQVDEAIKAAKGITGVIEVKSKISLKSNPPL